MSRFVELRLVAQDGLVLTYDYTNPNCPYDKWSEIRRLGKTWRDPPSFIRILRWIYGGQERCFEFYCEGGVDLRVDPVSDLIISTTGGDSRFPTPNDAVVLNPDGTLNHQIKAPRYVFKGDYVKGAGWVEPPHDDDMEVIFPPGSDTWVGAEVPGVGICHRVEGISHVCIKSGRLVIGLRFGYDWCEERFYDAGKRQWLERAGVYPFGMRG